MENMFGYNLYGYNMMPPTLLKLLSEDSEARSRFYDMNEKERHDMIKETGNFQSKEEFERYLYHRDKEENRFF